MFCSNLDAYRHETNLLLRRKKKGGEFFVRKLDYVEGWF